jgi:hypothetical protein
MVTAVKKPATEKKNTGKTIAGIKIPKKKVVVRRAHLADEKYTGTEPVWDTERALTFDDATFDHHLRRSFTYYNYHFTVKDLKPELVKWLQEQTEFEITKSDLSKIIRTRWLSITMCALIAAHRKGMPLKPRAIEFIKHHVSEAVIKFDTYNDLEDDDTNEPTTDTPKPVVHKPTIQDRLNEKMSEIVSEMEGWYDEVIMGQPHEPKAYEHLTMTATPQAMVGKIAAVYQCRKDELVEAQTTKDEQLKEAYGHYKAKDFKRHIAWLDKVLEDCDRYAQAKKTTRKVRAKKAPSKEKLVAKLKFCKDNAQLKLVSINPADILGAQELWVYNIKTRKLGKYVPDQYSGGLSVKGTSLTGFDENKSVSKTLRKPDQQLAEFMKSGKVQIRKFLDSVKATETRMNGRINIDTMLLRTVS